MMTRKISSRSSTEMLSISPDLHSGSMERAMESRRRQQLTDLLLVSPHDVILGSAFADSSLEKPSEDSQLIDHPSLEQRSKEKERSRERFSPCLLIRSKCQGWERSFELHHDWPIPKIQHADEILIRHRAIGLNPVDFKSVMYNFGIPDAPWVLGRDIAGEVAEVGDAVRDLRPGDRVWVCADARDLRAGAYQFYSVSRRAHVGRIGQHIQDSQAATLGTGLVTAAIATYWFFRWPRAVPNLLKQAMPRAHPVPPADSSCSPWVLIYGGGAITGIFVAQIARLSGYRTIAVASPSNFTYLTSSHVGVTHCVDRYGTPDQIQQQVLQLLQDGPGIQYVVDCVGTKTANICQDIVVQSKAKDHSKRYSTSHSPPEMVCLAGGPTSPSTSVIHHRISFSTTIYGDDLFASSLMDDLDYLFRENILFPAIPAPLPDGLAGVRRGLESLRDNKAPRAKKLVVHVDDTPHAHLTNLGIRTELGWNGTA